MTATLAIDSVMALAPVIPVLVIDDVRQAAPLAEALVAGGICALEVTLRTPAALEAITEMASVPGAVVGAGTVLNGAQLDAAMKAGARFIVSPGLTEGLARSAANSSAPLLPGVQTATDIMHGLDLGFERFKFFPAESSGGVAALKALTGPFGGVKFCPTGGITPETAPHYLSIPQVVCVGGSWLAPRDAVAAGAWARISALARAASDLKGM